jgi:membrane protease YdiL (CAAX protease family)
MTAQVSGPGVAGRSSVRFLCWVESLILGCAMPAAIWAVSRLLSRSFPADLHGSPEQRFMLWISAGLVVEWVFVTMLWFVLNARRSSFCDLGVWRSGTWAAWVVALLFAAFSIGSNLRFLPRLHIPISYAFFPPGFHFLAALLMGTTAGFCEEVLYRAFLMTEFAKAGYGNTTQVLIPGLVFGIGHAGYMSHGLVAWLGIALPTAFLGMAWGAAYLLGRRSLLPGMVAHFLNDATVLPWILFFMVTAH